MLQVTSNKNLTLTRIQCYNIFNLSKVTFLNIKLRRYCFVGG